MEVSKTIPDMNLIGVYSIRNKFNGKIYVGSTIRSFAIRMGEHLLILNIGKHSSIHLQLAWGKYGSAAFEFVVEQVCDSKDAIKIEQVFLDKFQSYDRKFGYNMLPTAGSTLGYKATQKTIEKKRKTMQELYKNSPDFRAKMLIASHRSASKTRGVKCSKELIEKVTKSLNQPDVVAKISAASKRKVFTPEYRRKLAAWQTGRKLTPEHKAKISAAFTKRRLEKQAACLLN